MTAHHQQHDETTNPGMVRGAAGARRASGHGRNDLDHDTPVRSRGGYMTMCSNDRLGRFANRSSHKFKSQRQPPERPSGFSVILRGRKRSLSPVTFACPVSSLSGLKRVGSSPIADGNCRGAHVAASALLSGLSQNDPYHRVQSAPCHLKYLSTARLRSVTRGGEFARNPCSKTFHIRARSADA